jgi:hypothetical protein
VSAKYGPTFLALAAVMAFAASGADRWAVCGIALCAALASLLMAVAYAGAGPRMLLKRPEGHRHVAAWPLLWPYFLMNGLAFSLYRVASRRPPYSRIAPNLDLGRRLTAREIRRAGGGWLAVLDLAPEFAEARPFRDASQYRSLPVLDATAPSAEELSSAVDWLARHVAEGPVYVHCALGHGRSATVVIAYLLASGQVRTVDEGEARVRSLRDRVKLNAAQRAVLRRFEAGGYA